MPFDDRELRRLMEVGMIIAAIALIVIFGYFRMHGR